MPGYFQEDNTWESVELFYSPPGVAEPPDTQETGSSNHADVFNRRIRVLVNRTKWLRNFFDTGRLKQFLALDNVSNRLLGFDSQGSPVSVYPDLYSTGDVKVSAIPIVGNPFRDEKGFNWYVPDGTYLSNANPIYEKLFKTLWSILNTVETKGTTADNDWNAGKRLIYPDVRGRNIASLSNTNPLNSVYGSNQVALTPEHYRHTHNFSLRGVRDTNLNFDATGGFGLVTFGTPKTGATGQTATNSTFGTPNPTNVAGNRSAVNDGLGALWDNTLNAPQPVTLPSPPSVALQLLIYTGVRN